MSLREPATTTITTTLGALADAEPALARLAGEKLPFAIAHRIAKLTKAVAEETRHFYETRNGLVREYGERTNGGGPEDVRVLPTSPAWPAFVARLQELAAVETTIPLAPLELTRIDGLAISAADVLALGPLVTVDAPPAPAPPT